MPDCHISDKSFSFNKFVIIVFIALCSVGLMVQSYNLPPQVDECFYKFNRFGPGEIIDFDGAYQLHTGSRMTSSFGDVVHSVALQYYDCNGRLPIHIVLQSFVALLPSWLFSVVNAAIFIFAALLLLRLATSERPWLSLWAAFILVAALLYLMPQCPSLYISPVQSPNYLWCLVLTILAWRWWCNLESKRYNIWEIALLVVPIGILMGWSHEGFALPLSGAWFFYYIRKPKQLLSTRGALVIAYWIGTLALCAAPGNFARLNEHSEGAEGGYLRETLFWLTTLPMLWIWLFSLAVAAIKSRRDVKIFIRANRFIITVWALTTLFSIAIHTMGKTFYFSEVLSLVLTMRLVFAFFSRKVGAPRKHEKKVSTAAAIALMTLFVVHYAFVAAAQQRVDSAIDDFRQEYLSSPSGVAVYDAPQLSPFVKPFVRGLAENAMNSISMELTFGRVRSVMATPVEIDVVREPEKFFVEANRLEGDAPFYATADSYAVWCRASDLQTAGNEGDEPELDNLEWMLAVPTWREDGTLSMKLRKLLIPGSYKLFEPINVNNIREVRSKDDVLYRIPMPHPRKAIGVRYAPAAE